MDIKQHQPLRQMNHHLTTTHHNGSYVYFVSKDNDTNHEQDATTLQWLG